MLFAVAAAERQARIQVFVEHLVDLGQQAGRLITIKVGHIRQLHGVAGALARAARRLAGIGFGHGAEQPGAVLVGQRGGVLLQFADGVLRGFSGLAVLLARSAFRRLAAWRHIVRGQKARGNTGHVGSVLIRQCPVHCRFRASRPAR